MGPRAVGPPIRQFRSAAARRRARPARGSISACARAFRSRRGVLRPPPRRAMMRRSQKASLHVAIRGPDRRQAFRRRTRLRRNHPVVRLSVVGMPRNRCGRKARRCQHQTPKCNSAHVPASPMSPPRFAMVDPPFAGCKANRHIAQRPAAHRSSTAGAETPAARIGVQNRKRTGQTRGLTGSALSISERSVGISWPEPAARAEPVAAAVLAGAAAAPDGRSGAAAAVAAALHGAAAGPEPAASAVAA